MNFGQAPRHEGPYTAAWRSYRLSSWGFWLLFFGYVPGIAYLSRAMGWNTGHGGAVPLAAITWMIAACVVGYRKWNFRCPRCGELFFRKFDDRAWRRSWQHNPFARRCMHCGLPKWASDGNVQDQS